MYQDLSTCRSLGMGVGPIPWTAYDTYVSRYTQDEDLRDYLWRLIRAMDEVYLDFMSKKSEDA